MHLIRTIAAAQLLLRDRRSLDVTTLADRAGITKADAARYLCEWTRTGDLRFCGADGDRNAHTHVSFLGEVYAR